MQTLLDRLQRYAKPSIAHAAISAVMHQDLATSHKPMWLAMACTQVIVYYHATVPMYAMRLHLHPQPKIHSMVMPFARPRSWEIEHTYVWNAWEGVRMVVPAEFLVLNLFWLRRRISVKPFPSPFSYVPTTCA